jgi:hypothetical protein
MFLSIKIYPQKFSSLNISKYFGKKNSKKLFGRRPKCYCRERNAGYYHSLETKNKSVACEEKFKYLVNA